MSADQQQQQKASASASASASAQKATWEGPKDAHENAKRQNKSIQILHYWDVYAPPPSESTKGKIGSALPFLRDWRTHIDFGRVRRISLELHGSLKKSRGSKSRNFRKHFLRISKDYHPNEENGYKTRYLIPATKFQIISNQDDVDGDGDGDTVSVSSSCSDKSYNPKEIKYTTFENGEHHEGSFIFDDYEMKDVQEFRRLMNIVAIIDSGGPAPSSAKKKSDSNSKTSGGTRGSKSSAKRKDHKKSKGSNEKNLLGLASALASTTSTSPTSRSTIGSLVERRDEELQKIQFTMRDTEKHSNSEFSTILSDEGEDDDDNDDGNGSGSVKKDEEKNLEIEGDGNTDVSATASTTATETLSTSKRGSSKHQAKDIFLPEMPARSQSPRPKRTPRQPRKKRPYKAPGARVSSSPSKRDRFRGTGGGLLQPVPPLESDDASSSVGSTSNDSSIPKGTKKDSKTKVAGKVAGKGLLQPLPTLDPEAASISDNSKNDSPATNVKRSHYVRSRKSPTTRTPSTVTPSDSSNSTSTAVSDIEDGRCDGPATTPSGETLPSSRGSNNRVASGNGCCAKVCHMSSKILVNVFQTIAIMKGLAILLYSVALFTYRPDPLIIVAVTLLSWSLLILIGNCTGMVGVNECRICGSSSCLILISIVLASVTSVLYCGLLIIFAIKENDLFGYLDKNHEKLFLIQDDIDYLHAHAPWIYAVISISSAAELIRICLLLKLRRDVISQRRVEDINNDELTEPLM